MMFLMVYLYTALEMMQNSLRTSGIGCVLFYFVNFVDENDVVGENSFASDVIWTANENSEVLLMWASLRSTFSSFCKHMCMRFSTPTPTETSFCRAAFYFWKPRECLKMILDVFGICQQDANGQC